MTSSSVDFQATDTALLGCIACAGRRSSRGMQLRSYGPTLKRFTERTRRVHAFLTLVKLSEFDTEHGFLDVRLESRLPDRLQSDSELPVLRVAR